MSAQRKLFVWFLLWIGVGVLYVMLGHDHSFWSVYFPKGILPVSPERAETISQMLSGLKLLFGWCALRAVWAFFQTISCLAIRDIENGTYKLRTPPQSLSRADWWFVVIASTVLLPFVLGAMLSNLVMVVPENFIALALATTGGLTDYAHTLLWAFAAGSAFFAVIIIGIELSSIAMDASQKQEQKPPPDVL
ncbi:MAG: hypothetical protein VE98_C0001G0247 [candidate division Kazan bacterium GW2011_GWA1_50_15]|uniref:Uncharacterized protein n=2 Tax=Bacteria division Kazan-3B-28 TaxID=1798534 RepID=A0A0G2A3L7_UNCK3|nr:MAG: hypothetical protein VE98_C0001G0247 [candidate division Kazan bacterium GW2011_GWA1_50_15]KKW25478.1 MAG: hypothetical protein VE99_C0001G0115 [candidate division Kazan bacterium GW2011_GWC1_52_13]KKW26784.1 MAG: hypothetical protein VF00_C0002G0109 [candidate division Kazan bacterium GW2011_GWB1_52_7]HAV65779.1 hypothetical protein [Patescibacteria group bacterium]HCR42811.1 hypothetical protein [Patescibacteria group bacterium]